MGPKQTGKTVLSSSGGRTKQDASERSQLAQVICNAGIVSEGEKARYRSFGRSRRIRGEVAAGRVALGNSSLLN